MKTLWWPTLVWSALALSDSAQPGSGLPAVDLASLAILEPTGLEDGDLVFRTGRDMISDMVLAKSERPRFSHVGVVVYIADASYVVHAIPGDQTGPEGVRLEPLVSFLSPRMVRASGYFRIPGLSKRSQELIRHYALEQVGKQFDGSLQYSDDAALYCTELVMKAIAAGGVDLEPKVQRVNVLALRESVIIPDALLDVGVLEPIEAVADSGSTPEDGSHEVAAESRT